MPSIGMKLFPDSIGQCNCHVQSERIFGVPKGPYTDMTAD